MKEKQGNKTGLAVSEAGMREGTDEELKNPRGTFEDGRNVGQYCIVSQQNKSGGGGCNSHNDIFRFMHIHLNGHTEIAAHLGVTNLTQQRKYINYYTRRKPHCAIACVRLISSNQHLL